MDGQVRPITGPFRKNEEFNCDVTSQYISVKDFFTRLNITVFAPAGNNHNPNSAMYKQQLEQQRQLDEVLAAKELRLQEEEARQLEREAFQRQQWRLADEVAADGLQHQQRARHEKERQECQELLEQVRQRQVRLAQRQVSTASASPECVPRAVTEDTETPSGSPFATLLDDAETDRSEAEASVFGSSAESSNQGVSVTPKRAQKPKGSTRKSSRQRAVLPSSHSQQGNV
jgi:hypothetical protein